MAKTPSKYNVTKHYDIIKRVAQNTELSQAAVTKVYQGIFNEIAEALWSGESVTIPGFAFFELVDTPARKARNPRTGEQIDVPAKTVVKVRRRKKLKEVPDHLA